MLRLYGSDITTEDAERVVGALIDTGSHASLEAAAAIRWGAATNATVAELEPDLRDAVLDVLDHPSEGLVELRAKLIRAASPAKKRTLLARRLHNPKRRECGCLSDCWCKRTAWGRALRWYVPTRHHRSVSPCWTSSEEQSG